MTSRNNEVAELLLSELEKYGLKGKVGQRKKHVEVAYEGPLGRRFVIIGRSPSDWRAGLRARSDLRRLLRKDNIEPIG